MFQALENVIIDNLGMYSVVYFWLSNYMFYFILFTLSVLVIYGYEKIKYGNAALPYAGGLSSSYSIIVLAMLAAHIGGAMYDVGAILYGTHTIPAEDGMGRLLYLARPIHVALATAIKYLFLMLTPIAIYLLKKQKIYLHEIYSPLKIKVSKAVVISLAVVLIYEITTILFVFALSITDYVLPISGMAASLGKLAKAFWEESPFLASALLIPLILFAAVGEEQLFRGLLYKTLRVKLGIPAAVLVSALLFALYHDISIFSLLYSVAGILFALLYEKTGSLYPSILAHAFFLLTAIMSGVIFGA